MKSLFRGLEERKREEMVKSNLMQELRKIVRELLNEHQEEGVIRSSETSNVLCSTLEAIFIHGLKETLVSKFSSVMAGPDQVPEPEFWSLVLVFSHRDIIQQIQKLTQITTDIGRSRAWIRLALNDALLPSYMESISVQNSALGPYYKKTAFLRDSEMVSNFRDEVKAITNVSFDFPTNSCLLNYWPTPPLLMAGLWTPPIKLPTPAAPEKTDEATDLVAELVDDVEHFEEQEPYCKLEPPVLYDENEALKIILGTPVQDSLLKTLQDRKFDKSVETSDSSSQMEKDDEEQAEVKYSSCVNIQTESVQADISHDDSQHSTKVEEEIEGVQGVNTSSPDLPPTGRRESNNSESFDLLLKNYNPVASSTSERLEDKLKESYNSLLKNYNPNKLSPSEGQSNLDNILQGYDLMADAMSPQESIPPDQMSASFIIEHELKSMVDHLGKLMLESGLISQNFLCKRCHQHIGITFVSAKVCGLTGHYFCVECFDEKESVIPARILHNWDFSKHPVSGKAHAFLNDVQAHPLINIRTVNPKLYLIVPEMEKLQKQRMRLNLLRMYLMTCREPVIEALKKQLWPREYLYKHIHLYSVSDLVEIPSSILSQTLAEVIKFCENHVINCQLCSQKGFICEVCNSKQIIFPFHLDTTYRCPKCSLVLHLACKAQVLGCPKCSRIQKRTN